MSTIKAVPEGASVVMPMLVCRDAGVELEFCKTAFDAVERVRRPGQDGTVAHALVTIGGAMVMIEVEWPTSGNRAPMLDGSSPVVIYVYVDSVDQVVERAVSAGAKVLAPVQASSGATAQGELSTRLGTCGSFHRALRKRRKTRGVLAGRIFCLPRSDPSVLSAMKQPPRELLEFLDKYDRTVQSLALGLRRVVHQELAPCHEYIFAMRSKVVLLYGATERVIDDGICHINVFVHHVNLGFSRGTDLDDRGGMLRGTRKAMRHISLKTLADLQRSEIRLLLQAARRNAGLTRTRRGAVVTRVKLQFQARRAARRSIFW
jgi:uncharacterized glyoxalase superfamily protein PhnB